MKLLRPLAVYTLYDQKTNDYIRRELRITCILDKIDEYRRNWLSHLQRMPQNRMPLKSDHKEGEQLEDRRSVGASSCNCGDGTDRRFQSLMFMMMVMNNLKFTLKHLKRSYMFRSYDHPQGAYFVPC